MSFDIAKSISFWFLRLLRYLQLVPRDLYFEGSYAVMEYYDNSVIQRIYLPRDKGFIGGYDEEGHYHPPGIKPPCNQQGCVSVDIY